MIPQFLMDEPLARAIQKQSGVLHPGMVVRLIGDEGAPERGTPDPEILIWLERHNYILVTNNRKTMPRHFRAHLAAGRHVPGILCFRRALTIGAILDELELIWGASDAEEYYDCLIYLPL